MPTILRYEYSIANVVAILPEMKEDSDVELTESEIEEYLDSIYGDTGDTGETESDE